MPNHGSLQRLWDSTARPKPMLCLSWHLPAPPADVLPPPCGHAAQSPPDTCTPCPKYSDDNADTRHHKKRFPQDCWYHTSHTHTHSWQIHRELDSNRRPAAAASSRQTAGCGGRGDHPKPLKSVVERGVSVLHVCASS